MMRKPASQLTRHLSRSICIAAAWLSASAVLAQEKPTAKGVADLEQAKREAVDADRALRAAAPPEAKKEPALSAGQSAVERFDKAADGAYIDRSNTRTIDHYRSADGVIIERITYGGKSYCVTSSTVNYVPGILHDSSKAREVTCPPANAGWVRK
ncbi:MAG: hypothetical protein JWR65_3633 [Massilia sp.]|jgi:hypothetical protein|nr:hypothetical protein [Massilia sp.]